MLRHLKTHDRDYWFYLLGFIGGEAEAHYGLRGLILFAAIVWGAFVLLVLAGHGGLILSKLRRLIGRR